MSFQDVVQATPQYFPAIMIKYKEESWLMQIFKIFQDSKSFMNDITILGSTIYLPCHHFIKLHPLTTTVLLLHELVHWHHPKKQAYLSSLYVIWKLSQKQHFIPHLEKEAQNFLQQIHQSKSIPYQQDFRRAIQDIQGGLRPFQDPIFDILDELINKF
jgi:hypothetical protein